MSEVAAPSSRIVSPPMRRRPRSIRRWIKFYLTRPRFFYGLEKVSPAPLGLRERFGLWCRGYVSDRSVLYDFARYGRAAYLPDFAYYVRCQVAARDGTYYFHDKERFHRMMITWSENLPIHHGVIEGGDFRPNPDRADQPDHDDLFAIIRRYGKLALKDAAANGGKGFAVLETRDGEILLNGQSITFAMGLGLPTERRYIVQEYIQQADYATRINPASVNSIRVIALRDPKSGEPFIAAAIHRFGTKTTGPLDHWDRGGISAGIDLESGVLGQATGAPQAGQLTWMNDHPDSGARIVGVAIPGWSGLAAQVLGWMRGMPIVNCCGWDVCLTRDGRVLAMEGNAIFGIGEVQVHGPLLVNERTRAFFKAHGVFG